MKTISVILCLVTFVVCHINAQTSLFTPGYVVVNGDTLRGLVEQDDELKMSKGVNFKRDLQSAEKRYSILEASAFGFDAEYRKFEAVAVELRKVNDVVKTTRFAKVLLAGFSSLYKLQVPEDERFVVFEHDNTFIYIIKKNSQFATLGMYEFMKDNAVGVNGPGVGINRNYRDVLKYKVFSDCPDVVKNIEGLEFNDKSMVKACRAYNACHNGEDKSVEYNYSVKRIVRHGADIGYVTLPINRDQYMTNFTGFMAGYFWDIVTPDISRVVSLRLAPNYAYFTTTDHYNEIYPRVYNHPYAEVFGVHLIRIPVTVQLNFQKVTDAKVIPYLAIGPVFSAAIKNESRLVNSFISTHFEGGTYIGKCKVSAFVENPGFILFSDGYSVNITFGYRFD